MIKSICTGESNSYVDYVNAFHITFVQCSIVPFITVFFFSLLLSSFHFVSSVEQSITHWWGFSYTKPRNNDTTEWKRNKKKTKKAVDSMSLTAVMARNKRRWLIIVISYICHPFLTETGHLHFYFFRHSMVFSLWNFSSKISWKWNKFVKMSQTTLGETFQAKEHGYFKHNKHNVSVWFRIYI